MKSCADPIYKFIVSLKSNHSGNFIKNNKFSTKMEEIFVNNKINEKLECDISKNNDSNIIFLVCHGFLRNKDQNFITRIFNSLNTQKVNVFKFSFSGCGGSEGLIGDSSYIKQQDDLRAVIDYLKGQGFKRFGLIGHSMGASVSILISENNEDIFWLIDIAGPANPSKIKERRFKDYMDEVEATGKTIYHHPKLGDIIFNKQFFDDAEKVDVLSSIKNIKANLLIVQGTDDKHVSLEESEILFMLAPNPKTIQIISDGDHNFTKDDMESLLSTIRNWVNKWVKKSSE